VTVHRAEKALVVRGKSEYLQKRYSSGSTNLAAMGFKGVPVKERLC
jgi:hypothetical protein